MSDNESIPRILIKFSETLQDMEQSKKVRYLIDIVDPFLREHKEIIKVKYSGLITSILRSL